MFHQRCLIRIRWFHHVRNTDVLKQAQTTSVETLVAARRLRWFGHVVRMTEKWLSGFLLDWKPNFGKRSRGRPRTAWISCVLEDVALFTSNNSSITLMKLKRWLWTELLRGK